MLERKRTDTCYSTKLEESTYIFELICLKCKLHVSAHSLARSFIRSFHFRSPSHFLFYSHSLRFQDSRSSEMESEQDHTFAIVELAGVDLTACVCVCVCEYNDVIQLKLYT